MVDNTRVLVRTASKYHCELAKQCGATRQWFVHQIVFVYCSSIKSKNYDIYDRRIHGKCPRRQIKTRCSAQCQRRLTEDITHQAGFHPRTTSARHRGVVFAE